MRWTIRYQLFVPLFTLLLGVVAISAWTAWASAARARQQIEQQVRDVVRTLHRSDFPLTPHVLDLMHGLSGAEFLVISSSGRMSAATLASDAGSWPVFPSVSDESNDLEIGPRVVVAKKAFFCNGMRLRPSQAPTGSTLYVLYPESLWREAQWEAVRPSLILGAFGGLASILLTIGVAQRFSRRIQDLERRTRTIAAGNFNPMELPGGDDELRDLGRSINEMAQQLSQLQATMKNTERLRLLGQVSGGLAHQLRNGVSGARLAIQFHARECNGHGDAEALDVALRQLALVEANVKRFLDLGRTEEMRRERCCLDDLIDETVALVRPQCRHLHLDLRWRRPTDPVAVVGDPGQLGHLFFNVIGNAIDAAGPGGWVEVQLQKDNSKPHKEVGSANGPDFVQIEISDSGPGPAPEIASRLFDPFVTGKPEGVGMGLAVARRVVDGHGGAITWCREKDRTVFHIELPQTA
jgi:signal transduction histidine kinase